MAAINNNNSSSISSDLQGLQNAMLRGVGLNIAYLNSSSSSCSNAATCKRLWTRFPKDCNDVGLGREVVCMCVLMYRRMQGGIEDTHVLHLLFNRAWCR